MKAFVSGGAGVIGSALIEILLQQGVEVWVGDKKPCPPSWRKKLHYRRGDLRTLSQEEVNGFAPDLFFHLAATFERTEESPAFFEENFMHNVALSHHLLPLLKQCPSFKRGIFASSYLVYDPKTYLSPHPHQPIALSEKSPLSPRNLCGAAKLFHEKEWETLPSYIVARIFRVYGKGSRDVISRWIHMASKKEIAEVYQLENYFDYIAAEDVAEALWRLSQSDVSGVVNLGSGQARSIGEVINLLKKHLPHFHTQPIPSTQPFEASQADITRLTQILRWKPTRTLESEIPKLCTPEEEKYEKEQIILITSISKKMPLIHTVRHAGEKIGLPFKIIGADNNPKCIARPGVDLFWQTPRALSREILLSFCQREKVCAIIPTRDTELLFYSYQRSFLEKEGVFVMVSSPKTITLCLDKRRFATELKDFPIIPEGVGSRYVVKERFGSGSNSIGLDLSLEEAKTYAARLKDPLIQPYIEGKEWSVDVYRSFRKKKVWGVSVRSRDLVISGEAQITTTASFPKLECLIADMTEVLQIEGHAVFQVIEDREGKLWIIECNPRFGGASTASVYQGLDSFYWFLLECLGEPLPPFVRKTQESVQTRYPKDRHDLCV